MTCMTFLQNAKIGNANCESGTNLDCDSVTVEFPPSAIDSLNVSASALLFIAVHGSSRAAGAIDTLG